MSELLKTVLTDKTARSGSARKAAAASTAKSFSQWAGLQESQK